MSRWDDPQKWIRITLPLAIALWVILPAPNGLRSFLLICGALGIYGSVSKNTRTVQADRLQPATKLERTLLFIVGVIVIAGAGALRWIR